MRIIYGVNSEGMGHATRSSVVIDHLQAKGHEVHIFASGRVYEFLAKKYEHTYQIKGFNLVYKDDKLLNMHSFFTVLRNLPKGLIPTFRTLAQKFAEIEPHVVISDFEFFTAFIAKNIGTPVISANNISLMSKGKIDPSLEFKHLYSRFFAKNTDTWASFRADQYVIPTFFFPQTRKKNVILTNPAIRQKIQQAKVATKDHVLVYHTS
ncbi:MAG: glycosyltransferase family protein, partial [Nanoarchaeota archaeon]